MCWRGTRAPTTSRSSSQMRRACWGLPTMRAGPLPVACSCRRLASSFGAYVATRVGGMFWLSVFFLPAGRPFMRFRNISGLVQVRPVGRGPGAEKLAARMEYAERVAVHSKYCADKHSLLELYAAACSKTNMWELAGSLSYNGPLELLSMWTCLFGGSTLTTPSAHALLEGGKARAFACLALPKLACCWSFVRACGFAQTCALLVVRPRHFAQVDGCSCPFGLAWARHAYLRIHGVAPHPATLIRLLERAAPAASAGEMDTGSGSGNCMCDALGQDALALAMLTAAML
jgi:hypothetical protein